MLERGESKEDEMKRIEIGWRVSPIYDARTKQDKAWNRQFYGEYSQREIDSGEVYEGDVIDSSEFECESLEDARKKLLDAVRKFCEENPLVKMPQVSTVEELDSRQGDTLEDVWREKREKVSDPGRCCYLWLNGGLVEAYVLQPD